MCLCILFPGVVKHLEKIERSLIRPPTPIFVPILAKHKGSTLRARKTKYK